MVENYLVFYIVTDSEAQIHRVIHGARRYEFLLEPADRRELFGGLMSVGAKIAVVADIHGNLEALKAVLEDAFSTGIEIFICCGDLVDYGPDPNEAVERIRAEKIPCVLGNHDRAVGEPIPLEAHKTASGRDRSVELACLQWTREQCTEVTKAFLRALPPSLLFERDGALGGSKVLVVHATPDSVDDYLWPDDGEGWQKLHRATGGY
ncbi:MAG: metallophosphoesterase, partial [Syntrophothermus sp.]